MQDVWWAAGVNGEALAGIGPRVDADLLAVLAPWGGVRGPTMVERQEPAVAPPRLRGGQKWGTINAGGGEEG